MVDAREGSPPRACVMSASTLPNYQIIKLPNYQMQLFSYKTRVIASKEKLLNIEIFTSLLGDCMRIRVWKIAVFPVSDRFRSALQSTGVFEKASQRGR
ncbi:hypothetical protein POVWA2_053130 [Plasmodium ovale wallikeri]|uniref:Uncharacterized protein n=1 Tax=Plasmodium ovale wallikeri TaxID=864142 RepID=A0A1A8ZRG1_PLAOA|nr:hypothetical protein POVWA1_053870 [Plasmodium ovale wallikeri]SBT47035.1 hypothetical protein POVWA2_053130 [Plasmodium ovale wallikeri]